MEPVKATEQRADIRTPASPPTTILRRGEVEQVEILNASYRGLFVRTNGPPPPTSQLLRFRIELPGAVIEVHGVPVRVITDGSGRTGIGVRFFALNGEPKQRWEAYIASLLTPRRAAA